MKNKVSKHRDKGFWAHSMALVESKALGCGTRVWAFSHVMQGAIIGRDCNIGEHVFVENGAAIGDRVTVKNGVQIWEGVTLNDDVFVGPNVAFTNDRHPRSPRSKAAGDRYESKGWLEKTVVGDGAAIGANATIICGITIGKYAVIGAGSVVTESVAPFSVVMGVPALCRGFACICGRSLGPENIMKETVCANCGRSYSVRGGCLRPGPRSRVQKGGR